MKKLPLLIGIPAIAFAVVVSIALILRVVSGKQPVATSSRQLPNTITGGESGGKPATFLGGLIGTNETPTPTSTNTADLSRELKNTVDDGGSSDFKSLDQVTAGL